MNEKLRLDVYVQTKFPKLSRSSAAKLIEQNKVKVNGSIVTKPSHKVSQTDKIKIDYESEQIIPKISLPVIYEDDDCVVINKPVGVLTHSKGTFNPEATVATWLSEKVKGLGNERAGIVHRLDRATSGVMICAKNPETLTWLQRQFSQRKVKKTYIALITGTLDPAEAVIDMPIERNPKAPATFRVGVSGKPAVTHYKTLKTSKDYSLLELKPTTGRTHQLRVHLAKLGHPIVGDTLYGGEQCERLLLHAAELEITMPSRDRKTFKAKLPAHFLDNLTD